MRKDMRKKKEPEDSEEELVFYTNENSTIIKDQGIMKNTEFTVTERVESPEHDNRASNMKPWERQPHAS